MCCGEDADEKGFINIGRQGTGGAVQLNNTHFMLTWPKGAAITDDPELHTWTVYHQTEQNATGFGMYYGNTNAVWTTTTTTSSSSSSSTDTVVEMAVSGAVGQVKTHIVSRSDSYVVSSHFMLTC